MHNTRMFILCGYMISELDCGCIIPVLESTGFGLYLIKYRALSTLLLGPLGIHNKRPDCRSRLSVFGIPSKATIFKAQFY